MFWGPPGSGNIWTEALRKSAWSQEERREKPSRATVRAGEQLSPAPHRTPQLGKIERFGHGPGADEKWVQQSLLARRKHT